MDLSVETSPDRPLSAATWAGFAAMCVGMFMAILDVQIVATSLPTIQYALAIAPDQMSWVQTAYLIAEVIAIPLTGLLTRLLGMRRLFVLAVTVFTAASAGCAASGSFAALVAWRVLQGFSGGTLIPAVFAAVFILFPRRRQGLATTLAGVLAVLAPTVGPVAGGWITATFSWHWLFLVNVLPGLAVALIAGWLLPRDPLRLREARGIDLVGLALMALALAALEIGLKEAPDRGWTSGLVVGLMALSGASAAGFLTRAWRAPAPFVDLATFADRRFAFGCALSFILGIGLFGSVYLMPVFLAFVRGHDALGIGEIMLVTGVAQLAMAPVAVALEQRLDARLLTAAGFAVFAIGLGLSAFQTPATDFGGMFWPQVIRGPHAIMFCLLAADATAGARAPRRGARAVDRCERPLQPDAQSRRRHRPRADRHGDLWPDAGARRLARRPPAGRRRRDGCLRRHPAGALSQCLEHVGKPLDDAARAFVEPLVRKAALTEAINDAWLLIAVLTAAAALCVPFIGSRRDR